MLEAAEASRWHAFIVLCLLTGVRSEEARTLTWEHVDLEAGTIYRRELRPVITTGAEVMDQIFRPKEALEVATK